LINAYIAARSITSLSAFTGRIFAGEGEELDGVKE
jgi:hypothetical protein